jgi:hypothetical protein
LRHGPAPPWPARDLSRNFLLDRFGRCGHLWSEDLPAREQIGRCLRNHVSADPFLPQRIANDQRVVTDDIDEARDPPRHLEDPGFRIAREKLRVQTARSCEACLDVFGQLVGRKRLQPAVDRYALPKLSECRVPKFLAQLGLAGQNDLQDLLLRRLQIRK